ncbi:MAG: hypothetical protein GQ524_01935 [Anaerolineales bacterium]|nr:hypothetical protein [Anaerolineales bacterium]
MTVLAGWTTRITLRYVFHAGVEWDLRRELSGYWERLAFMDRVGDLDG